MCWLTPPSPLSRFTSEICHSLPTAGFKLCLAALGPALCSHLLQAPRQALISGCVWAATVKMFSVIGDQYTSRGPH